MGRHTVFVHIALTAIWVVLVEELSWQSLATGMFVAIVCLHFAGKFLPYEEIRKVSFFKLIAYPFVLVGQIYKSAFNILKMLITGYEVDIVTVYTELKNENLRVILSDSVTLTPGTILLDAQDNTITVLWMRSNKEKPTSEAAGKQIKGKLEEELLKAEREAEVEQKRI